MTVGPAIKNKVRKCNACLGNAVRNGCSSRIGGCPLVVCAICQSQSCVVTTNVLCNIVGNVVESGCRDNSCDIAARVNVFLGVFGGNINRSLCNGNGNLYFANVVVAYLVGSEDCHKGVNTCIANCGGCGCTLDAPCTLYACGKCDNILEQITVGCGECKIFKYFGVIDRSNLVIKLLSCTCAVSPNVVVAYKSYYCGVSTNVCAAVVNNGVALGCNKTGGLECAVVCLVGNARDCNCLLCNCKGGCFTLCGIEVIVACKDCLNVVRTCVCKICDLACAFRIGEVLECDFTLCKCFVEACIRCVSSFAICPTVDGGSGNGNICLINGYVNRSGCCEVVCTFSNAVSDNVFACNNDCVNCFAVLCNNELNGCTVGSGCHYNGEFIAVIILGIGILYSVNGYSCLCDRKVASSFSTVIVVGVLNLCSYDVSTCIGGNGGYPSDTVFGIFNNVGNHITKGLVYGNYGSICCLTVGPAVDSDVKGYAGSNNVILESKRLGFGTAPCVVCTIIQGKNCLVCTNIFCNVSGNAVQIRHRDICCDIVTCVEVCIGVCGSHNYLLRNYKVKCLNKIVVVGIGNNEFYSVCACIGRESGSEVFGAVRCIKHNNFTNEGGSNSLVFSKCIFIQAIGVTVSPLGLDGGFNSPFVISANDVVFQFECGVFSKCAPFVACIIENDLNLIGTNIDTAVIDNGVSFGGHQTGGKELACVNLILVQFGNFGYIDVLLCNLNSNRYFDRVVVAGCGSKDCHKDMLTYCTNSSSFINILQAPITLCVFGKHNNIYRITVNSILQLRGLFGICLCNRYGNCDLYTFVVCILEECNKNCVNACFSNACEGGSIFVGVCEFRGFFSVLIGIYGSSREVVNATVVNEVIAVFNSFNYGGCFVYFYLELNCIIQLVVLLVIRNKRCHCGFKRGIGIEYLLSSLGIVLIFSGVYVVDSFAPNEITIGNCGKNDLTKGQSGSPSDGNLLIEINSGIDLLDDKTDLFFAVFDVVVSLVKSKLHQVRAGIGICHIAKHIQGCIFVSVFICNNVGNLVFLTVVIKYAFNNCNFYLYLVNIEFHPVILLFVFVSGHRRKDSHMLYRACFTNKVGGICPLPSTVGSVIKVDIRKLVAIANGILVFKRRNANIERTLFNSKSNGSYRKIDVLIRRGCGNRIFANTVNGRNVKRNKLLEVCSIHSFGNRKLIRYLGNAIADTNVIFFKLDDHFDHNGLDFKSAFEYTLVVFIYNYKAVLILAYVCVVRCIVTVEQNALYAKLGSVCLEGGQLNLTVVNKAFNNIREVNYLLGYKNGNGSNLKNLVGFGIYKFNLKFVCADSTNGALCTFELPFAAIKARELDICQQIAVNSIDCGKFGKLGSILFNNTNLNCALFENLACCKLYKFNVECVFANIANRSLGICELPFTNRGARKLDVCKQITVNCIKNGKLGNVIQHGLVNCSKGDVALDNTREVVGDLHLSRSILPFLGPALKAVSCFFGSRKEVVKLQLVGIKRISQAGSFACFFFQETLNVVQPFFVMDIIGSICVAVDYKFYLIFYNNRYREHLTGIGELQDLTTTVDHGRIDLGNQHRSFYRYC